MPRENHRFRHRQSSSTLTQRHLTPCRNTQHRTAQTQQSIMSSSISRHTRSLTSCLRRSPNRTWSIVPRNATQLRATSPLCGIHTTAPALLQSRPPKSRDRGPKSNEDTQTDFSALDVLRNTAAPATSIDACTGDGFALNNQMRISGCGLFLLGGEAFRWRPWLREERQESMTAQKGAGDAPMTGRLLNAKKQWEVPEGAWGVLELVYPKPGAYFICCTIAVTGD